MGEYKRGMKRTSGGGEVHLKQKWIKAAAAMMLLFILPIQASAYTKLEKGASGDDVWAMQTALQSLGYSITVDGKYGPATVSVVKSFQRKHGLYADGIAGDKTLSLLYTLVSGSGNTPAIATAVPASTTLSPQTSEGTIATVVTGGASLNLRLYANSEAKVIATIPNGEKVIVHERDAGWASVVYEGMTGYVMVNYLSFEYNTTKTPVPNLTPVPVNNAYQALVVTTGGSLNLRETAGSGGKVIAQIPYGAWVTVNAKGTTWSFVSYNGQSGYVMNQFLSFGLSAPTVIPTVAPTAAPTYIPNGATAYVATVSGSLNLRQSPDSSAKVLLKIPNGMPVQLLSRGNEWCAVVYEGTSGYVMTSFLRFTNASITVTPAATPTPAPTASPIIYGETAIVATSGGSLNLREHARSGAKVLLTIPNGTVITVSVRESTWCSVSYQGVSGYVMTSYLRFPSDPSVTPVPTATASPSPTPVTPGVSVGTAVITTSGGSVNLRAQASSSAKVLLSVPNAGIVSVQARGPEWSAVTYNGTFGYIMSKYMTILSAVPADDGEAEEEDPSVYKRTLKKGMTGEDVTWVQHRLDELGYSLQITNIYDDATFSAVKSFQSQNGLDADGLAGSQTFSVLKSENARRADAQPLSYATLRIDQSGDGVRKLQTDLKALGYPVTVNGTFDTDTHNAVVAFQQRNGLVISGIADALTRQVLHGGQGKPYSSPVTELPANEGWMASPAISQVKLLNWQNEIKPYVKTGQTFTVLDPNTNLSWKLVFYSLGRHADSQPASWRDTQIMNRSFGSTSWTIHPVYVLLPSGQWTLATMHNRPHLYGSINNNGFGGHLCVHFLRDMAEAQKNDPNYGVNNQITLRSAWKALTGETVD